MKVDPRACGGACGVAGRLATRLGRSPRVRGSLDGSYEGKPEYRSIPARAGEPSPSRVTEPGTTVDPRACGGAADFITHCRKMPGRSPRVRGSRLRGRLSGGALGSIPARAGEPVRRQRELRSLEVDPRACGGAAKPTAGVLAEAGRSPRVRGSLDAISLDRPRMWSIPARAGEPGSAPSIAPIGEVDPRACGGAMSCAHASPAKLGRSPRVRGSHDEPTCQDTAERSIPARAGEPQAKPSSSCVM